MDRALSGIKIVDLSTSALGPLTCMYMGAHGATVVWVESTRHPDLIRVSAPFKDNIVDINRSGILSVFASCKLSLGVNLDRTEGLAILTKLVTWADAVVESYRPGVLEGWGLAYDRMKELNPDIILVRASMQGQTGPRAAAPGWGWMLKGLQGQVHFTGWPDRPGIGLPIAYSDTAAPWHLVATIVAALDYRQRTGKGQYVDFSQLEASLHLIPSVQVLDYTINNRDQGRDVNHHRWAAPHGVYPCAGHDRWCAIAVFSDAEWHSFCRVLRAPEWSRESRFSTFLGRKRNEDELDRLIGQCTADFDAFDLITGMQEAGVTAGVVQTNQDIVDHDPQLKHRRFFRPMERAGLGTCLHMGLPAALSTTPYEIQPPPRLGQDTDYVCRQLLGMSDEEFGRLLAEGVLEIT